jgi:hypothetical protein
VLLSEEIWGFFLHVTDLLATWKQWQGPVSCVGIQKHFMGAEIPGFGLPNQFFGLTTSYFFRDGIVN